MKTEQRKSLEDPTPEPEDSGHGPLQFLKELPGLVIMAFVLALVIKTLLFQAFFIPSGSMEPTLMPGDRVLVNKVPYYFHDPRPGEIIVFENPHPTSVPNRGVIGGFLHWLGTGLGFTRPGTAEEDYIKRVIGLPGDSVQGKRDGVYVNGVKLNET